MQQPSELDATVYVNCRLGDDGWLWWADLLYLKTGHLLAISGRGVFDTKTEAAQHALTQLLAQLKRALKIKAFSTVELNIENLQNVSAIQLVVNADFNRETHHESFVVISNQH